MASLNRVYLNVVSINNSVFVNLKEETSIFVKTRVQANMASDAQLFT